jgi:hypothetical protein
MSSAESQGVTPVFVIGSKMLSTASTTRSSRTVVVRTGRYFEDGVTGVADDLLAP